MNKKTVLVTGLHGFIGTRFAEIVGSNYRLIDFTRKRDKAYRETNTEIINGDITDEKSVFKAIGRENVDIVLHLAAKAHIDRCEGDRRLGKFGETWKTNVEGTRNIARACAQYHKYLLYLSTECVFDGEKGFFTEEDAPNPINWYGETKQYGEEEIRKSGVKYCILRSVLSYGHCLNYPKDILQVFYNTLSKRKLLKAVNNQNLTITFIDDLVSAIDTLIKKEARGIYHFSGSEVFTPYVLAQTIKQFFNFEHSKIESVSLEELFGKNARLRLRNATLSNEKIENIYIKDRTSFMNFLEIYKKRLDSKFSKSF